LQYRTLNGGNYVKRIVSLTINPAIDVNTSVNTFIAEIKLRCSAPHREPGGGGINVSRAVKKLGGDSLALYTSGGLTGQMLKELLDSEDLENVPIPIKDITRENIIVYDKSTTNQYRLCMPGPELAEKELKFILDQIAAMDPKPDYIVASGSLPPNTPANFYARVAKIGKEIGSKVIVDTHGEPLRSALQAGVFLIKPNFQELGLLAGHEIKSDKQMEEIARKLIESGQCEVVVVSLGAAGVFWVSSESCKYIRSPAVIIKSKVGAGDSMIGGIVLKLAQDWTVKDVINYGVAAGTAAVMTPGTELCRLEDTERLYEELKTF
jgi:6-phosphofructokinase 2